MPSGENAGVLSKPGRPVKGTTSIGASVASERFRENRQIGTAVIIGGRVQAKQVLLPNVLLGASKGQVSVLLVKAPSADILPGIDGIVGLTALKARQVHFDSAGKRLTWE